jgi:hypothetical protein
MTAIGVRKRFLIQENLNDWLFRHFYIVLAIPLLIVIYHLSSPGMSLGEADFPYAETSLYSIKKLAWTWIEYGSYNGIELVSRFPLIALWTLFQFATAS